MHTTHQSYQLKATMDASSEPVEPVEHALFHPSISACLVVDSGSRCLGLM